MFSASSSAAISIWYRFRIVRPGNFMRQAEWRRLTGGPGSVKGGGPESRVQSREWRVDGVTGKCIFMHMQTRTVVRLTVINAARAPGGSR